VFIEPDGASCANRDLAFARAYCGWPGVERGRAAAREALAARAAVPVAAGMKGTGPRPGRRSPALPSAPAFDRTAEELRGHVGRLGAERVAELLRVGLDDLGPLLEGRVGVAKSAMAKLRLAQ